ncbi:DUF294 nucleotidyltransferase-like domain-containing protein [Rhizobiaceae bacterium BDR2-2]|uniref:DUF294 nucleotidyltransferase-like domain-containing protein n=1 Tax=Ectorhizobium quercum TaxID=2965071 RepID=A0AAE3N0H5_9HYPH|nr:DUF294 nucleotidyltransferase-like domain-containing protein [Ectorhizobium quercum]MCX8998344.1 DUF294 nucleotidyltransferase-like domain-containing protein [Ectorhizobium quercum]
MDTTATGAFLETVHPYDGLSPAAFERVLRQVSRHDIPAGSPVYGHADRLAGLYIVMEGRVEIRDASGALISELVPRDWFGERGLLADGHAATAAKALTDVSLLLVPADVFRRLVEEEPAFARLFARPADGTGERSGDMATRKAGELMSTPPLVCAPQDTVRTAAETMRDRKVSCLGVVDGGRFAGIVTLRDLTTRVLAAGLDPQATPVSAIMTRDPVGLAPGDLGSDVLHLMLERGIGHLPVVENGRLVGMITQTDLTRLQAISPVQFIRDIARARQIGELQATTARIPQLLVQLVGGHGPHEVVTRRVTDIADAVTRRLIAMAEERFGPPPVPYLWLACGSQGRQEQTGVSDQDNCILIDDGYEEEHRAWFENLAGFVCTGLNACGYVFCPGDMMATNPRWCQPVRVWRGYFRDWIARPDPMARMLSSVMFDLRPIAGTASLFSTLQAETLGLAGNDSIFVAHMVANALKHAPPLGLLRGFATLRSGEHRNRIDMKHNGVVPVVDLARVYALVERLTPVNTRARLLAAEAANVISGGGARDLVAAYDLIAEYRLRNQAAQVKAGAQPDNYLDPYELGEFERSQLRDAFVIVRTMQAALANRGVAPV